MRKNIANIITFTRIIGTIVMCFTDVLSVPFFIFYTYSGLSDIIDGFIARKLNIESDFGRKLDSISDLIFYTAMMIKIWPYLVETLPTFAWALIWIILGIRIALYLFVSVWQKKFLSNHTILNKICGCLMFGLPYLVKTRTFLTYCEIVIAMSLISALYEIVYVIKNRG